MPLREVALPEAVGTDGAYEARIDTIYIPWKPHEIKTIVTDLTNIEKCPKKWYKNIVSVQKTQQTAYGDIWILIDCAMPERKWISGICLPKIRVLMNKK